MFGLGILLIIIGVIGGIVGLISDGGQAVFALLMIAVGAAMMYYDYLKFSKEEDEKQKRFIKPYNRKYQNHCWYCYSEINSNNNKKCPKCNRYYICNHCGRCLCDSPNYRK